jgi:hypothetical protein
MNEIRIFRVRLLLLIVATCHGKEIEEDEVAIMVKVNREEKENQRTKKDKLSVNKLNNKEELENSSQKQRELLQNEATKMAENEGRR